MQGLGCGGCGACNGLGYSAYDHPLAAGETEVLPGTLDCYICYNHGDESAEFGPPPWVQKLGYRGANSHGPF